MQKYCTDKNNKNGYNSEKGGGLCKNFFKMQFVLKEMKYSY